MASASASLRSDDSAVFSAAPATGKVAHVSDTATQPATAASAASSTAHARPREIPANREEVSDTLRHHDSHDVTVSACHHTTPPPGGQKAGRSWHRPGRVVIMTRLFG